MIEFLSGLPYKTYVGVFLCSLFASYWLVPRLAWLARGLGLLITTRTADEHVPSLGGLALGLPFLTGISLLLLLENQVSENMYIVPLQTRGLFLGSVAALAVGLLHDLLRLPRALRLLLQLGLGGLAYHYGFRFEAPGGDAGLPQVHILPLTLLWIVGLINLLEVLNRHTRGLAKAMLVVCLALLVAAFAEDQYRTIVVACFLSGALLGLLSHGSDLRPDLGSSGTYFLGYVLSVAALQSALILSASGVLLFAVGAVILLAAASIRLPLNLLKPSWVRAGRVQRLRSLRHYRQAVALELESAPDGEAAWKLLCRAAEAFGLSGMVLRPGDGAPPRSWGQAPEAPVTLPLAGSGGHLELSLNPSTKATDLPLFRELVGAFDRSLEAHNLRRVADRSAALRVLLVNRYHGDMSATGQIVQELAEDLPDQGAAVSVLAGSLRYEDGVIVPGRNEWTAAGVHVARIPPTHFGRATHLNRLMDFAFFYGSALLWLLRTPRQRFTHVVVFTDPPLIAILGLLARRLKGWVFVYGVQDLYPETAHALGILRDGPLYRGLRALNDRILRGAHGVVAVSRSMARRIQAQSPPGVVEAIPNWTDSRKIQVPERSQAQGPFRVVYTGNMGLAQQVDLVIRLLRHFAGRQDVEFLFVGGGVCQADLRELAAEEGANVRVLDYVAKDRLSAFLADSDLGLVTLSPALEGLALPTKTYTYLAAGLPLLTFGAHHGDFEELIVPGWGRHFSPDELSEAIAFLEAEIRLGSGRAPREQIRAHFVANLDRPVRTAAYHRLLDALAVRPEGSGAENRPAPAPSAPTKTG